MTEIYYPLIAWQILIWPITMGTELRLSLLEAWMRNSGFILIQIRILLLSFK